MTDFCQSLQRNAIQVIPDSEDVPNIFKALNGSQIIGTYPWQLLNGQGVQKISRFKLECME